MNDTPVNQTASKKADGNRSRWFSIFGCVAIFIIFVAYSVGHKEFGWGLLLGQLIGLIAYHLAWRDAHPEDFGNG